jgi:4-hydroxy-tetrahydrodipicolinate synthase
MSKPGTSATGKIWTGNIVATVTPFNKDGSLDTKALRENFQLLRDEGIDGYVVMGDTGEFWALTDQERQIVTETALDVASGEIPVVVGCGAMTAQESIRLGLLAKDVSADGIMLTPPIYVRPGQAEIEQYYRDVISAVGLPTMLYNIPKRHSVSLGIPVVDKLADLDLVVAFKQSHESFLEVLETIRVAGDRLSVLAGHSVERGFPAVAAGADGYLSSVEPQVMGKTAIDMYKHAVTGDYERARDVQLKCVELDHAIHGDAGTFPASLKAAMNLVGRPGGYPRPPLQEPNANALASLKTALTKLNLI